MHVFRFWKNNFSKSTLCIDCRAQTMQYCNNISAKKSIVQSKGVHWARAFWNLFSQKSRLKQKNRLPKRILIFFLCIDAHSKSATEATLTISFLGTEFTVIDNHQSDCYIINMNLLRAAFNLITWIVNAYGLSGRHSSFFFLWNPFSNTSYTNCLAYKSVCSC